MGAIRFSLMLSDMGAVWEPSKYEHGEDYHIRYLVDKLNGQVIKIVRIAMILDFPESYDKCIMDWCTISLYYQLMSRNQVVRWGRWILGLGLEEGYISAVRAEVAGRSQTKAVW